MKKWLAIIAILLAFTLLFAACRRDDEQPAPAPGAEATPAPAPAPGPADPAQPAGDDRVAPAPTFTGGTLPRNETLFFGGLLWGAPNSNNPFHPNANSQMIIEQIASGSRVSVYETLFMFNMLDGQLYPLLATGQPTWSNNMHTLTVNLNPDAHWSDGTPFTADDVVATFETHKRVSTGIGIDSQLFIDRVVAVNDHQVELHANPANFNPQILLQFMAQVYMQQAAFLADRHAVHGDNHTAFREDPWDGVPFTGPYMIAYQSALMTVLERNDNYWGQAASMWGALPVPRFLAHNVYADNDVKRASFAAGQIDVNQQFMSNVWELWEAGLPISTFLDEPPFYLPASMPSIWFNTNLPGLDNRVVRQAIALSIDYDQIAMAAMSGYTPTFLEAPRSVAAPLAGEQEFVNNAALAHLQFVQNIDEANRILDEAGIVDTDGDGIREYPPGNNLSFTLNAPAGWTDWNMSLEIVAAGGAAIGIELTTNFTEMATWTEMGQTGTFEIRMAGAPATTIIAPWSRVHYMFFIEDPNVDRIFRAYHRMYSPEINALILEAAAETNMARLREIYTELSVFLLEEKPLVYLMYRPWLFHTVNESVWTGFPEYGDGTNVPPQILKNGFGIAGLYNIRAR